MSVNLAKNESVNLTKALNLSKGNSLNEVMVCLGWDEAFGRRASIDCDASVIVCRNGHYTDSKDLIYFGNKKHKSGAVQHYGDNLTGKGKGDDEQILIRLDKLPNDVDRIPVVVNIYSAISRNQHFGMIKNAFVRIVNVSTNEEICRYNLSENYSGKIAMIFGELYKVNNEWQFKAIGEGTSDNSVNRLANRFS